MKRMLNLIFIPVMIILGALSMAIGAINTALTQPLSVGVPAALVMVLVSVLVSALGGGWLTKRFILKRYSQHG